MLEGLVGVVGVERVGGAEGVRVLHRTRRPQTTER